MKTAGPGAHPALLQAVRRLIAAIEGDVSAARLPTLVVEASRCEAWSSATFSGQRHAISFRLGGRIETQQMVIDRLADIGEAEFRLPGHIVADISLVRVETRLHSAAAETRLDFEALTVED